MNLSHELSKLDAVYEDSDEDEDKVVYIADDREGPHIYVISPSAIPEVDSVPVPKVVLTPQLATATYHALTQWGRICIPVAMVRRYLYLHGSREAIKAAIKAYCNDREMAASKTGAES